MKRILLLLAVTVFALSTSAQTVAKKLTFGAKAGINFPGAKVKYSGRTIKGDGIIGFHLGGFAAVDLVENITLQGELLFSNFGAKTPDGETKTTLNYINLPLLAKYKMSGKVSGLGFYAGPQIGILTSAKLKFAGEKRNAKDDIKSTDLAGIIGAEYYLPSNVGFNIRYVISITSIAKESRYKEHHNMLQVGVQYRFKN